jgi:hypothetical protein
MTFNVILGRHIWGITAEGTGPIASLINADVIDSEVIGKFHIGPVYELEIVRLQVSIARDNGQVLLTACRLRIWMSV